MNPRPLVVAELRRNAMGCAAIVALIAIAVALGVAVTAQERALRQASTRAAERFDLIVGASGSSTQLVLTTVYLQAAPLNLLPAQTLSALSREPGAADLAPVAVTDSYRGHTIVGTTAAFVAERGVAEGRMFAREDEAVVGSAVTLALGETLRPTHGTPAENALEAHEHTRDVRIVGRLAPTGTPWDRAIVLPIEAIWAMHAELRSPNAPPAANERRLGPPWAEDRIEPVPAIVVRPRSVTDAYQLRAKYRGRDTVAVFPAEVLLPLYALLGEVHDLIAWMALAFQLLLIVAVLLVIIAVLASRRQTIGVLRALGAPPTFVFVTVWLQGALLMATGVAAGLLLGSAMSRALSAWVSTRTGLAVNATPGAPEVAFVLALLVVGSTLAALPSLAALRVSTDRLLRIT
jgi:putative ABC transport system permease protein